MLQCNRARGLQKEAPARGVPALPTKSAPGPGKVIQAHPQKASSQQYGAYARCAIEQNASHRAATLTVPMRRCWRCRDTVKGVKTAWLGNAVAMMHYLRIVNSGGRQKWHGHDHKDEAHATLPIWRGLAQQQYARVEGRSMLPLKMASSAVRFSFQRVAVRLTIAVSTHCHWTRDAEPRRPSCRGFSVWRSCHENVNQPNYRFLLAITYSTIAFAVDCNAVRDSCWRTLRQDYEACSQKYFGQRQTSAELQSRPDLHHGPTFLSQTSPRPTAAFCGFSAASAFKAPNTKTKGPRRR